MLFSRFTGLGALPWQRAASLTFVDAPGWTWGRIEQAYKAQVDALIVRAQATRDAFNASGQVPACSQVTIACASAITQKTYTDILEKGLASGFFGIMWPL